MTPVTADDVRAFVLETLGDALAEAGLEPAEVADDFDLLGSGLIDSLGVLELIEDVNTRFGLEIDFEELDPEGLTVVGPFSRFVARMSVEQP